MGLSVTITEYGKSKQAWYLIDEAILGKIGWVYVTYVVSVDEGQ